MNTKYDGLFEQLCSLIKHGKWNGVDCILEMRNASEQDAVNYGWRQMEWFGWYLEYLIRKSNYGNIVFHDTKSTNDNGGITIFDFYDTDTNLTFDVKTHVVESGDNVICNDYEAIKNVITEQGNIGMFIVDCTAEYDHNGEFKKWHDELKGKKSKYVTSNPERRSRTRKKSVTPVSTRFIIIDNDMLGTSNVCKIMHQGKNSNGKARPDKLMIDVSTAIPICSVNIK